MKMLLDIGLRSGTLALLVLLALDAFLRLRKNRLGHITLLLNLCGIAFLIETAPQFHGSHAMSIGVVATPITPFAGSLFHA